MGKLFTIVSSETVKDEIIHVDMLLYINDNYFSGKDEEILREPTEFETELVLYYLRKEKELAEIKNNKN